MPVSSTAARSSAVIAEADLVRRAAAGDAEAIRRIVKTHNQRLYRLVRAVLRNDEDAEDVLQEAYLHAFARLGDFQGEAALSTWLTRIALNAALMRLRARKRLKRAVPPPATGAGTGEIIPFPLATQSEDPERVMAQRQLLQLVEEATDALPEPFRLVFVARVIEGLDIEETAAALDLPPATVKTRLHRARKLIRAQLEARVGPVLTEAFPFAGARCERLTEAVLEKLKLSP